jgi:hypothetical protein
MKSLLPNQLFRQLHLYTPIPTPYYSLNKPTEGEQNIADTSTPLPKTTINEKGFKKEVESPGYDNAKALRFIESLIK